MTRHEVREVEFLILYEKMFHDETVSELITMHETDYEFKCDEEVEATVEEIVAKQDELDGMIAEYSRSRAVSRIAKVNLAILRLAFFEILYRSEKVPQNAAVNEAVGLAKAYGQEADVKFVNGVLGAFTRRLNNGKA